MTVVATVVTTVVTTIAGKDICNDSCNDRRYDRCRDDRNDRIQLATQLSIKTLDTPFIRYCLAPDFVSFIIYFLISFKVVNRLRGLGNDCILKMIV